jgi:hypothetical protein
MVLTNVHAQVVSGIFVVHVRGQHQAKYADNAFLAKRNPLIQITVPVPSCVHKNEFDGLSWFVFPNGVAQATGRVSYKSAGSSVYSSQG